MGDVLRALLFVGILAIFPLGTGIWFMTSMPSHSYRGPAPAQLPDDVLVRRLQVHVRELAGEIGERNFDHPDGIEASARYIEAEFRDSGCALTTQDFEVWERSFRNIECTLSGTRSPEEILIIGAHYDSVSGSPGANDNASGVAVLIELARVAGRSRHDRTVRFVGFANEEPPFFQTPRMGSLIYADRSIEREEHIAGMISIETVGYFDEARASQTYPPPLGWFYPSRGNFVAFVANPWSRALVRRSIGAFRDSGAAVPSEGIASPGFVPGVAWSDHWSFWIHEIPAIMITDTALYRYEHYHTADDTPDKLDYGLMAEVTRGLEAVVVELTSSE